MNAPVSSVTCLVVQYTVSWKRKTLLQDLDPDDCSNHTEEY